MTAMPSRGKRPAVVARRRSERLRSLVGVAGAVLVLAGFATVAWLHAEPAARGFDEIWYEQLHGQVIRPGEAVTQPVRVQAPGLTRVAFLYSYTGTGEAPVDVTVRSAGAVLGHSRLGLRPTLTVGDREAWWSYQTTGDAAPNTWQTLARFQEVPVRGPAAGTATVTLAVPKAGRPLLLYWNPSGASRRYAIRTEYGPVRPALLAAPTFVRRMAGYGSPWLPAPALWLLIALVIGLFGALTWKVAGVPAPHGPDQPNGGASGLD